MPSLAELRKQLLEKQQQEAKLQKPNQEAITEKPKPSKPTKRKVELEPISQPQIEVIRIPVQIIEVDKLKTLTIGQLRGLHKEIFGVEPPHDSEHNKLWIANKIKSHNK